MTKAALQPIHYILTNDHLKFLDKLYASFDIEAEKHEHDLVLIIDTLKGLKSGKITLNQIEVTDDAWEVLDADMVPPGPILSVQSEGKNGRKSRKAAVDAVPTTSG